MAAVKYRASTHGTLPSRQLTATGTPEIGDLLLVSLQDEAGNTYPIDTVTSNDGRSWTMVHSHVWCQNNLVTNTTAVTVTAGFVSPIAPVSLLVHAASEL